MNKGGILFPLFFYGVRKEDTMETMLSFIQEFGFPAAVTLYLLNRIEAKLEVLNASVVQLPEKIADCTINKREVS